MRRPRVQGRKDGRNRANQMTWTDPVWSTDKTWGPVPDEDLPARTDQYSGQMVWGRGYYVTDHWFRW